MAASIRSSSSESQSNPAQSEIQVLSARLVDTTTPYQQILPDTSGIDDNNPQVLHSQDVVYKYYFLFVLILITCVLGLLFFLRQRRKRRKTTTSHLGRNALVQDLERWQYSGTNTSHRPAPPSAARRWLSLRSNQLGLGASRRQAREDGVNEMGEVPPPYKARETTLEVGNVPSPSNGPSVPLQPLSQAIVDKPPEYNEIVTNHTQTASPAFLASLASSASPASQATPASPAAPTFQDSSSSHTSTSQAAPVSPLHPQASFPAHQSTPSGDHIQPPPKVFSR